MTFVLNFVLNIKSWKYEIVYAFELNFYLTDMPYKFNITFKKADNYPVDLYFIMDLSQSMNDDKDKLAELGDMLGTLIH